MACSAESPLDPGLGDSGSAGKGSGGSAGSGSGSGGSAASANGGTSGKGGALGNGGTSNGGTGGSGTGGAGPAGTGGMSGGGAGPAGSGGSGGVMNGGGAGSSSGGRGGRGGAGDAGALSGGAGGGGTSGTGGSSGTAKASPGCGKAGRPSSGQVQVANTSIYKFPTGYDGMKPFPLLIAIHACGNPNTEFVSITDSGGFGTEYVRSFPNTPDSGQCWSNYSGDVSRITMQYDELMNNYCIDENRVFAIAHSSGAQLLVNILSHKTDAQHLNLRGVSPVAADPYNVAVPTPVLYIDGQKDTERDANSAKNAVAKFRTSNSCMDTSKPYAPVMGCNSTESGHPAVDPGCIIYDGCTVPTIWCSHNDPSYSGTEHGIPCFAIKSMYDFFATL
jgi:polyhydroxybutyrate depolymerase